MKPVRRGRANPDLFRERLDAIINMRHSLVRLAELLPWSAFDENVGKFFKPVGRPAKPTRLMVGLHYLKHVYNLSDEEVVERWVENACWQYFCGFEFFQHELPIDPSPPPAGQQAEGRACHAGSSKLRPSRPGPR